MLLCLFRSAKQVYESNDNITVLARDLHTGATVHPRATVHPWVKVHLVSKFFTL